MSHYLAVVRLSADQEAQEKIRQFLTSRGLERITPPDLVAMVVDPNLDPLYLAWESPLRQVGFHIEVVAGPTCDRDTFSRQCAQALAFELDNSIYLTAVLNRTFMVIEVI